MNYALVHENGEVETGEVQGYMEIQGLVGGIFTVAPILPGAVLSDNLTTYVHDEGLIIGLPRNRYAERLTGYAPLVGPMVIMGPADIEGETLPLPNHWVETIRREVAP